MRPPDDVRKEIVRQWLAKAQMDLEAAETLLAADADLLYPACFHSQQASEKYIKAYLTWHQIEFPKTHVFGELLDLISQVDEGLAVALTSVTALNPYGVEVRYPSNIPEPTRQESEKALLLALEVRDAVLKALPPKVVQ